MRRLQQFGLPSIKLEAVFVFFKVICSENWEFLRHIPASLIHSSSDPLFFRCYGQFGKV